jgi:hypothetical protein
MLAALVYVGVAVWAADLVAWALGRDLKRWNR